MEQRILGRTGLRVSVIGFGCGAVGGLLVRGSLDEQRDVVARALELGINYFDTAAFYGESEVHLARTLTALKARAIVGTKVMLRAEEHADIGAAIARSVDASLRRLGVERIDIMQLHNVIGLVHEPEMRPFSLTADQVLDEVLPALERQRQAGKLGFIGMSGNGATDSLLRLVRSDRFDTVQVIYNLLNPSAGEAVDRSFPAQDFGRLLHAAREHRVGVMGIRVLAGGALSGSAERHPVGAGKVDPLGSGASYDDDIAWARRLEALVSDGMARDLVEASLRYVLANPDIATAIVGLSSREQLEHAAASTQGPGWGAATLERVRGIQREAAASGR